jgi:acyl-coenzyme A thioesterase PaaI-like protein
MSGRSVGTKKDGDVAMTEADERAPGYPLTSELHADARGHFVSTLGFQLDTEIDDRSANGSLMLDSYLQSDHISWPNLSALLTLADVLIGRLASHHTAPRISVTANLSVRLFEPPLGQRVECRSRLRKVGRTMSVGAAEFFSEHSAEPFGTSIGTFLASPRPADELPVGFTLPLSEGNQGEGSQSEATQSPPRTHRLEDHVGIEFPDPGVAEILALRPDLGNATGSLQGGVVALLGEAATYNALRAAGSNDQVVDSLEVYYLAAARQGPFRATAELLGGGTTRGHSRVEIRDLGRDRLTSIIEATTRPFRD